MSTKNEVYAAMRDLSVAMQTSIQAQQSAMNALVRLNTAVVALDDEAPKPAPKPVAAPQPAPEPRRWMPRQVPPTVKAPRAKRGAVIEAVLDLMNRKCGASLQELREVAHQHGASGAIGESTIARYCASRSHDYFVGHRKDGTRAYYLRHLSARAA